MEPVSFRAKWFMGIVLSIFLPLKQKWESMRQLEGKDITITISRTYIYMLVWRPDSSTTGKVEMVVEEVEVVAEVVEKAAAVSENVSAKVADQFPDNSRIKEAALAVEHISTVAVADAQLAQNFIHKVYIYIYMHTYIHIL